MTIIKVPLPESGLDPDIRRTIELEAIESFLRGKRSCDHHFLDDPSPKARAPRCRLIATEKVKGKWYCSYHLPCTHDPLHFRKLEQKRFDSFAVDFNAYPLVEDEVI